MVDFLFLCRLVIPLLRVSISCLWGSLCLIFLRLFHSSGFLSVSWWSVCVDFLCGAWGHLQLGELYSHVCCCLQDSLLGLYMRHVHSDSLPQAFSLARLIYVFVSNCCMFLPLCLYTVSSWFIPVSALVDYVMSASSLQVDFCCRSPICVAFINQFLSLVYFSLCVCCIPSLGLGLNLWLSLTLSLTPSRSPTLSLASNFYPQPCLPT